MDLNRGAASSAAEPLSSQAHDAWSLASPASLFTRPLPRAQVIFKKRRWSSLTTAATDSSEQVGSPAAAALPPESAPSHDGNPPSSRPPRVFTTKRTELPAESGPADAVADAPAELKVPLRRRRPTAHSPGKVIRLLPGQSAVAPVFSTAATADSPAATTPGQLVEAAEQPVSAGFDLGLSALHEHETALNALSVVSQLLDEAAAASRLRF